MTHSSTILCIASDIGGARAIAPVIPRIADLGMQPVVAVHGPLADEADTTAKRLVIDALSDKAAWTNFLQSRRVDMVLFGSGVADRLPVQVAKWAQETGIPTLFLLDNWMNYRRRMQLPDGTEHIPDIYAVMDQLAYDEAKADGIRAASLQITGQPALASLQEVFDHCQPLKRRGLERQRPIITFIAEPAADDQGRDASSPTFRGYTEYTVLSALGSALSRLDRTVTLRIAPHPRQDINDLHQFCQQNLQDILWELTAEGENGREAVLHGDVTVGMASILLYESWLFHIPTLSLQPNLCQPHLATLGKRPGLRLVTSDALEAAEQTTEWLNESLTSPRSNTPRSELQTHAEAGDAIARLIARHLERATRSACA